MDREVGQIEFNAGNDNSGKYKVEAIWDSAVYARKLELGHLSSLYYLVSWKEYPEEKNIWEPVLAIQYPQKAYQPVS